MRQKKRIKKFIYVVLVPLFLISYTNCGNLETADDKKPTIQETILKISVLGDSYSTFEGFVTPPGNAVWYTGKNENTDVVSVKQTWWHLLQAEKYLRLEVNNSFSGSTICNTGYNGGNSTATSFITRMSNLGNPDIIIIFGGTNDSWAGSPMGEYKYSDWTTDDLNSFRPAFAYMLNYLQLKYPKAKIVNVVNTELRTEIVEAESEICKHYMVNSLQLVDIKKMDGHPNVEGMKAIKDQVLNVIKKHHNTK